MKKRINLSNMQYIEFTKKPPVLYGQITVNGKSKIGSFRAEWNHLMNALTYQYYSPNGRKGTGGFSLWKAFVLLNNNQLSTNSENGKPENYL
jgi:hypothetical protein